VIDFCRANGLYFILGVAPTSTLRRHIQELEAGTKARFEAGAKTAKLRRFKAFFDGAKSWSRVERIIARVEAGEEGTDTRFIVTNLAGGRPKMLYERLYCRRGIPLPAHHAARPRPATAARHLNAGAPMPPNEPLPSTANSALLAANLKRGVSARRQSATTPMVTDTLGEFSPPCIDAAR
jgi:hypothetical protein